MKKVIDVTGIKPASAEKMVEALNKYLADLHVYYANLRGFHWHVAGVHFFGMHEKLEELYNEVFGQIDEVAERILMLDGVPTRLGSEIAERATVKEAEALSCAKEISTNILETLKTLIAEERNLLSLADELDDVATDDLITGFLAGHEKQAWMFTAMLKNA